MMRVPRLVLFLAALAPLSGAAQAQNFFELLFGIRRPPPQAYPPRPVPEAPPMAYPEGPPGSVPGTGGIPSPGAQGQPTARPVALKAPTEDSVLGRELKLNGAMGSLRLERSARAELQARLTLAGTKVAQPTESCTARLGGDAPLTLAAQGRPDGVPRYEIQAPACPIQFDVLDGAVLVKAPVEACVIEEAGCVAEVTGLWGPPPAALLPMAQEIEQTRGAADRAVRENFKALTQRARPGEMRSIVAEQAAFSSEREQLCRSYAREAGHGFCNARFTEARGLSLTSRLGLNVAAQTTADQRPRRSRPVQTVEEAEPTSTPYWRQEMVVPR
jgi:hypothetical protein